MNAKAKAKELVDRFNKFPFATLSVSQNMEYAKQCALICVDEIMKIDILFLEIRYCVLNGYYKTSSNQYWQEVKQEIELLKQ